jgi:RNA polymerase sigma factor (sigma-70 family)
MTQPRSETVIVTALRNGHVHRAIELLLGSYQEEVYGYCARLAGVREGTSVYQQVITAAMDNLLTFDLKTSIRAWLYRLARLTVIHHHQHHVQHYPAAMRSDYVPIAGPKTKEGLRVKDEQLETALAQLPPSSLEILQLLLWHNLALTEVAEVISRPLVQVQRLATAGLHQLSVELVRNHQALS